jgi:aspartyl-tRNA(Asn)/glutamyl-tRNA(Gln) amidotransferase subunit A
MNKKMDELTIIEYVAAIKKKEFSAADGVKFFTAKIKKDHRNAVLEVFKSAAEQSKIIDEKIAAGKKVGRLCGAPIIIKDNILYRGHGAGAASKMLNDFVSPYTSTIVQKMLDEDAIILGRANMDEFAMGTTGETSFRGATLNALDDKFVAGGSSSGSAVAVAAGLCLGAIGTDTGGSIRCPAAWNGLYSLKPTYGTVSRFGIIAFASSLDQAGPICKTVDDTALLLDVIRGRDPLHDATSIEFTPTKDKKVTRVGYVKQVWEHGKTIKNFDEYEALFAKLKARGIEIVPVSIDNIDIALATYYIIAPAEAASNLARFDGVRYTFAPKEPKDLSDLYKTTRTEGFGSEVKRRINLGNYVLSSGYFDAFYNKARRVQTELKKQFDDVFKKCDLIIIPTTTDDAPRVGEKFDDPVANYLIDLFTVVANIVGTPALACPFSKGSNGLPTGLQIMGNRMDENAMVDFAKFLNEVRNGK